MAGLEGDPTSSTFYIDDLVVTNPDGGDAKSQGDDHMRLIKKAIKNTFPNIAGPVTATQAELNKTDGVTVTPAEINMLASIGTTTVATQLAAKSNTSHTHSTYQATITGAATTIDTEDLTASRALVSNSSGKVAVSSVTDTELGYLSGASSALQTQITNLKKFDIQFNLDAGANGSYTIVQDAQFAFTIDSAYYQTESGTITVNVKYDGTNSVTSLSALSVTSTEANTTAGATKTVSAGNKVVITTSSNSSTIKLSVLLHCTRT